MTAMRTRTVAPLCALLALLALSTSAGCGDGSGGSTTSGVLSLKTPPTRGVEAIAGDWRGRLHQKGVPSFTITATIASSQRASENRVHYTGIDCSGHWTYLGRSGPAYRFREVIDRGRGGKCKGSGIVSVKELLSPKRLLYSFRGGGVASRGVLLPGSSG